MSAGCQRQIIIDNTRVLVHTSTQLCYSWCELVVAQATGGTSEVAGRLLLEAAQRRQGRRARTNT